MVSVVEMRWLWPQNMHLSHFRPLCEWNQGISPPTLCSVAFPLLPGTDSLRLTTTTAGPME